MTERQNKKKETYASKHDFHIIPTGQVVDQVKLAVRAGIPLALVGPSGIGKTAMVRRAAELLSEETGHEYKCTTMICSQKVPEDFTGIPIPDMEKECVKFFKLDELPRDGHGILFLDEINQADMTVLRALFQLLGERSIGTYTLPPGWQMIAALNPDGENYGTTKPSPALRRRLSWVEVRFDEHAFLQHASEAGFHETVVEFLRRNPKKILNQAALKNDKVFASPASWERFSDIIFALKDDEPASMLIPIGAGLVGLSYTKDFVRFFDEHRTQIDPKEVFEKYHRGGLRDRVKKYVQAGRTDVLANICNALVFIMMDAKVDDKKFKQRSENFTNFFIDLPDDTAVYFLNQMGKKFKEKGLQTEKSAWTSAVAKSKEGGKKYLRMIRLTTKMAKEKGEATF